MEDAAQDLFQGLPPGKGFRFDGKGSQTEGEDVQRCCVCGVLLFA